MKYVVTTILVAIAVTGALLGIQRKDVPPQSREYLRTSSGVLNLFDVVLRGRWLLVFQNPHELRPTGGFWGTVGTLSWSAWEVPDIAIGDVYAIDGPAERDAANTLPLPPKPLERYLGVRRWFLRDANWDPDFSSSAQQALELYGKEMPDAPTLDGVIAISAHLFDEVLAQTGPITVDGITFSSGNAIDAIIEEVELGYEQRGIPPFARKAILEQLARQSLSVLLKQKTQSLQWLLGRLPEYRDQKLIQWYARDPSTQALLRAQGWAGELDQREGEDFLFVVDANLASYKTDAVVRRSTMVSIEESEGRGVITLDLLYQHTKPQFDYRTTRYRSYTRVYVPKGSSLLGSSGTMADDRLRNPNGDPGVVEKEEIGAFTVFGFFFSVEPGEQHTVTIQYKIPDDLWQNFQRNRKYQLRVRHQPGVLARPLTVEVNFGTPKGPIVIERLGKKDEIIDVSLQR